MGRGLGFQVLLEDEGIEMDEVGKGFAGREEVEEAPIDGGHDDAWE